MCNSSTILSFPTQNIERKLQHVIENSNSVRPLDWSRMKIHYVEAMNQILCVTRIRRNDVLRGEMLNGPGAE